MKKYMQLQEDIDASYGRDNADPRLADGIQQTAHKTWLSMR
jgi:hypothetical protein